MELISKQNDRVYMSSENEPVTNSLILAKEFDRRHWDVVQTIKKKAHNYPEEFAKRNFSLSEYRDDTGKMNQMYELTKDGFWAIVFGFSGPKAGRIQAEFISEFNRRAEIIRKLQEQIRSENTCALPEPRKEYKHKYSYLQMKATADGFVEHEWVSGAKTIAEMDEIENHARLQHKRASMGLGYYKALIAEMHPRDRYSQEHVDFLETASRLSSHFKPRAYGAKIIQVPIFSMSGVPHIGLDAMNGDHDAAS
jgi:Rha family phage regulatory protein